MTTRAQDEVIDQIASDYGAAKVLPMHVGDSILVCGWEGDRAEGFMTFDHAEGFMTCWWQHVSARGVARDATAWEVRRAHQMAAAVAACDEVDD